MGVFARWIKQAYDATVCRDHKCSHSTTTSADHWPDHVRLSDIEPGFVCTACGKRGAEVRTKFTNVRMDAG